MDLSIFERVFALRDEARKMQLSAGATELPDLKRSRKGVDIAQAPSLPDEKIASDLLARAAALLGEANKIRSKDDRPSSTFASELLRAASTPLPIFDESDLDGDRAAPVDKAGRNAFTIELAAPVEERGPAPAKKRPPKKKKDGGGVTPKSTAKKTTKTTAKKTTKKSIKKSAKK